MPIRFQKKTLFRHVVLFLALTAFLCSAIQSADGPPKQDETAAPAPAVEKATSAGDKKAPEISEKVVTELRIIPYQKIQKPDDTLQKGTVKVLQQGRQGRERVTYRVRMEDGRTVERTVLGTEVLSAPKPHVELIGTAPVVQERTLMEVNVIPFQREQKPDDTLPTGAVKVIKEGREGKEQITYRIRIVDGKETERIVIQSEVLSQPENQLEAVGTGKPVQAPSPSPPPVQGKEEK